MNTKLALFMQSHRITLISSLYRMFTIILPYYREWEGRFQPDSNKRIYLVSTTYKIQSLQQRQTIILLIHLLPLQFFCYYTIPPKSIHKITLIQLLQIMQSCKNKLLHQWYEFVAELLALGSIIQCSRFKHNQ